MNKLFKILYISLIGLYLGHFGVCQGLAQNDTISVKVLNNLINAVQSPNDNLWPPFIELSNQNSLNANIKKFYDKESDSYGYKIILTNSLLTNIVGKNVHILAFILSHELAHISLGHLVNNTPKQPELIKSILTKNEELEADIEAMRISIDAGYSFEAIIKGIKHILEIGFNDSQFECLGSEHPSWAERLGFLNNNQKKICQSLCAFKNGVTFLSIGHYYPAIRSFRFVASEFPDSYEAIANIGYAKLMEYISYLESEDIEKMQVGQIVTGCYYKEPRSIEAAIRGTDTELWWDAIGELKYALKIKEDEAIINAQLGMAYLFSPLQTRQSGNAEKYLSRAIELAEKDSTIDDYSKAVIYLNYGIAKDVLLANNTEIYPIIQKVEEYSRFLGKFEQSDRNFNFQELKNALTYNKAVFLSKSMKTEEKLSAIQLWEKYFQFENSKSKWRILAEGKYKILCSELGVNPKACEHMLKVKNNSFRKLINLSIKDSNYITLSESLDKVLSQVQGCKIQKLNVIPGKNIKRVILNNPEIELLASDFVFAIFLKSKNSPNIIIENIDTNEKNQIHTGMDKKEFLKIIGDSIFQDNIKLMNRNESYRYYNDIGLAVKFCKKNNTIEELVITQLDLK